MTNIKTHCKIHGSFKTMTLFRLFRKSCSLLSNGVIICNNNIVCFECMYLNLSYVRLGKAQAKLPKQMRTYEDSVKSKKTVASMIERKGEEKTSKKTGNSYIIARFRRRYSLLLRL